MLAKRTCIDDLQSAGFSFEDAHALRRISMTLHRWFELECGDSNNHGSWAIVRGRKTKRVHSRDPESQASVWIGGEFIQADGVGVDRARKICNGCPVLDTCLEYALDQRIEHGVWGGCSERERRRILKRRRVEVSAG